MRKLIIWDLDGTLFNVDHRVHHVRTKPKNWPAFEKSIPDDPVYEDMKWLNYVIGNRSWNEDVLQLIVTGRGEHLREITTNQLTLHGIWYDNLYMRPLKDNRKDFVIKEEILHQITTAYGVKPFMWFEDRSQNIEMLRRNGVRAMQIKDGDY
jgi:phosphoglycolate phosphatase-like HAD superfamily hydrolase